MTPLDAASAVLASDRNTQDGLATESALARAVEATRRGTRYRLPDGTWGSGAAARGAWLAEARHRGAVVHPSRREAGRPMTTRRSSGTGGTPVLVRLSPDELAAVDALAARYGTTSRAEALRRAAIETSKSTEGP